MPIRHTPPTRRCAAGARHIEVFGRPWQREAVWCRCWPSPGERALERAETLTGKWAGGLGPAASAPEASVAQEIARIEHAILQGAIRVLDEFGGLQAALKRSVELKKRHGKGSRKAMIDGYITWRSARLAEADFERWQGAFGADREAHNDMGVRVHQKGFFKVHGGFSLSCWLPCGSVPAAAPAASDPGISEVDCSGPPSLRPSCGRGAEQVFTRPAPPFGGSLPSEVSLREGSQGDE